MTQKEREFNALRIRAQYTNEPDPLVQLDSKVKKPAFLAGRICIFVGVILVVIGYLMLQDVHVIPNFGTGGLKVVQVNGIALDSPIPEDQYYLVVGSVFALGFFLELAAFPLRNLVWKIRKKKYAPQIIALADEVLENQ
jgi:hypothetical protein